MSLIRVNFSHPTVTLKPWTNLAFQPFWSGSAPTGNTIKRSYTQVGTWTTSSSGQANSSYQSGNTINQPLHQGENPYLVVGDGLTNTSRIVRQTFTGLGDKNARQIMRNVSSLELSTLPVQLSAARQAKLVSQVTELPQQISLARMLKPLQNYFSPENPEVVSARIVDTLAGFNAEQARAGLEGEHFYDARTGVVQRYTRQSGSWVATSGHPVDDFAVQLNEAKIALHPSNPTQDMFRLDLVSINGTLTKFVTRVSALNSPPTWITPSGEIARIVLGDLLNYQLLANDQDGDTLTFDHTAGTLPPNTTWSEDGLLYIPVTLQDGPDQGWKNIDPVTRLPIEPPAGRLQVVENSWTVYRTPSAWSGPITKNKIFNPVPGTRYTATYTIRKISNVTNGIISLLRPQFDYWASDPSNFSFGGNITQNVGYTGSYDCIDTSYWELNKWYTLTVEWVAPYGALKARPRIRVNRNGPGNGNGETNPSLNSTASYELLTQNVVSDASLIDYNFTFAVTDSKTPPVPRNFTIKVAASNVPPVWQTASPIIMAKNSPQSIQLLAIDEEDDTLIYTLVSGSLPSGLTLNNNGLITGTTANVSSDTSVNVTIQVTDSHTPVNKTFTLTVLNNNSPVWDSNNDLGSLMALTDASIQLAAHDPDGDPLTYSLESGSELPTGLSLSSSGLITGQASNADQNTTKTFTILASDGVLVTPRVFSLYIQEYDAPPSWVFENNTYEVSLGETVNIWLGATDPEGQPLTWTHTSGDLPEGLSMSSDGYLTGVLSGGTPGSNVVFYIEVTDGYNTISRMIVIEIFNG